MGNIFEIGNEYTFAADFIERVLEPQATFIVANQLWTLDNSEVSDSILEELLEELRVAPLNDHIRRRVVDQVYPTLEFLEHVNRAIIVSIRDVNNNFNFTGAFDVFIDLQEVVYGEITEQLVDHFLRWPIRTRDVVTVGNEYLILQGSSSDSTVARHGAVIPVGSPEFYEWMELFEKVN